MNRLLFFVGVLGVLYYIGLPLLILFVQKMKARPQFELLSSIGLLPGVADYIMTQTNALSPLGFMPEAYLALQDAVPNVKAYLVMLANRQTNDKAMVTVLTTHGGDGPPQIGTRYLEFSTRFQSGRSVDTMNSATLTSFKKLPEETKIQVPTVQDPATLYRIHRYAIEHEAKLPPMTDRSSTKSGRDRRIFPASWKKATKARPDRDCWCAVGKAKTPFISRRSSVRFI